VSDRLEEWLPQVYRFARRLTADADAAEDLAQETLLRAWRHRSRLRDQGSARVWLFRIAANLWRDGLRRKRLPTAHAGPVDDVPDSPRPPERCAVGREDLARALAALDRLPPRQRDVLYLLACEGLSIAEIATVLRTSPAAAKASLSVARKKLREQLPDLDPEPDQPGQPR
jgi:RNA polymerase sigma-70 factor (ECF subfamily)